MDVKLERRNISAKIHSVLLPNSKFNLTICDGSCHFSSSIHRPSMHSTAAKIMSRVCVPVARTLGIYDSPSCVPIVTNNKKPVDVKLHVTAVIRVNDSNARDQNSTKSVLVRDYGMVRSLYNVDACTCA